MNHDPYEKVYQVLNRIYYLQLILELNGKVDSNEYQKLNDYIEYLHYTYLTPKTVDEVFAYKVLPGKITHTEFKEWLRIIGREDLLKKYYPNTIEIEE